MTWLIKHIISFLFRAPILECLEETVFKYFEKTYFLTLKKILFLLQLVLEEAFVLAEKIKKQTNLCMSARRVISMIQQISPHTKKLQNIDDNLMRNTGLSFWLVSCFLYF